MCKPFRILLGATLLAIILAPALGAQDLLTLHLVPDDLPGAGSQSMAIGPVPGPGGPVASAFDFTESQRDGQAGYLTLIRDPQDPAAFDPADFHLLGWDRQIGASLRLTRDRATPGLVTTSDPPGGFPVGATVTAQIPLLIAAQGAGLGGTVPTSGVLTASGVLQPGFFHQACLFVGTVDVLPGLIVSFNLKQDFFVPWIRWRYTARVASSSLVPSGALPAQPVQGSWVMQRNPVSQDAYTVGPVLLESPGPVPITIQVAVPLSGIVFSAATRTFQATLFGSVNGMPFSRTTDGIGESFEGSVSQPMSIRIEESGLPGIDLLVLDLQRTQIVPEGQMAVIGQTYSPVFRGVPGTLFVAGAALDAAPGISTEAGDVFVELDPLLVFSTDPSNPIFLGFTGIMPPSGEHALTIQVPNDPLLAGLSFFLAGALLDGSTGSPLAVTNSHRVDL